MVDKCRGWNHGATRARVLTGTGELFGYVAIDAQDGRSARRRLPPNGAWLRCRESEGGDDASRCGYLAASPPRRPVADVVNMYGGSVGGFARRGTGEHAVIAFMGAAAACLETGRNTEELQGERTGRFKQGWTREFGVNPP